MMFLPPVAGRIVAAVCLLSFGLGCSSKSTAVNDPDTPIVADTDMDVPEAFVPPDEGPADTGPDTAPPPDTKLEMDTVADSGLDSVPPPTDTTPPVGDGSVGSTCYLDKHCDDGMLCLDWPNGYCTHVNCPVVAECPAGSDCVQIGGGTNLCLAGCDPFNSACSSGYGCKPFKNVDGDSVSGCFGLNEIPQSTGGLCKEHADCDGAGVCLTFVPDGYCAYVGCSAALPCPEGTACVSYNGQPTCMSTCQEKADCLFGEITQRMCASLINIENAVVNVCIPAVEGAGVGSQCTSDIECSTGQCWIVADGKCVSSDLGCFSDADCPGAGICEKAPAYLKGICTQACAGNSPCPGSASCVQTSDGNAWCQVACQGPGDLTSCDKSLGEACVFGDPVSDTAGGGKFVCAVLKAGDPGMACESSEDCKSATCLGSPGVCAPECPSGSICPFPTTCVVHDNALRCMRRCHSVQDCPSALKCKATSTSSAKICVP